MSYRQSFTKRIAVHYEGTVSYPRSETGGSRSYSGTTYEDIEVTVEVDTEPFDKSVKQCSNTVGALTAGVVATEAAEVLSIEQNSKKVGDTIINGFFKTVQFGISTQIVELQKKVDALLLDLKEKGDRLMDMKKQMEADYNRTASRYAGIFGDLNKELKNRVYELDRPVYNLATEIDKSEGRSFNTDLIQTITLAGRETSVLGARIGAAITKQHATKALDEARTFLYKKQRTEATLANCTISGNVGQTYYEPVCMMESRDANNNTNRELYSASLSAHNAELGGAQWQPANREESVIIEKLFNVRLNENYSNSDPHTQRVREQITKLFNNK